MLRGVNKRIIEINDTGSEYFEKVLFVVNEDKFLKIDRLEQEARRITADYFGFDNKINSLQNTCVSDKAVNLIENKSEHIGFLRYTERKNKRFFKGVLLSICAVAVIVAVLAMILL